MENLLWKRLRTCCKTDYRMNDAAHSRVCGIKYHHHYHQYYYYCCCCYYYFHFLAKIILAVYKF